MKKILLVVISLFSITYSFAQDPWIRIFGSNYYAPVPISIRETYDKAVLLHYRYQEGQMSQTQTKLQKVDLNGLITLWQLTFGSATDNLVYIAGLDETPDGGLILYGDAKKNIDDFLMPFIIKLNACMQKEWCKIDTSDYSAAQSVIALSDGTYVILRTEFNSQVKNIVTKLDASGRTIWKHEFASDNPDYDAGVMKLMHCKSDNTIILLGGVGMNVPPDSLGQTRPYISKITTDGEFLWEFYSIPDPIYNNLYITYEHAVFASGNVSTAVQRTGDSPAELVHLDKYGGFLAVNPVQQPDTVPIWVNSMEAYNADKFLLGIKRYNSEGHALNTSLLMTDFNGNILDEAFINENSAEITSDISVTSDNKILTVNIPQGGGFSLIKFNQQLEYDSIYTNTSAFEYDFKCDHQIESTTIDMDCSTYGIDDQVIDMKAELLPNPASDYLVVRLPEMISNNEKQGPYNVTSTTGNYIKGLNLQIYDINGRKVSELAWPDNNREQVISTSFLNDGLYLIKISGSKGIVIQRKFVIKR